MDESAWAGWTNEVVRAVTLLAEVAQRDDQARDALAALGRALSALALEHAPVAASGSADAVVVPPGPAESVLDIVKVAVARMTSSQSEVVSRPSAPSVAPDRHLPTVVPAERPAIDVGAVRELAVAFRTKTAVADWAVHARQEGAGTLAVLPTKIAGGLTVERQLWFADHRSLHKYPAADYRILRDSFDVAALALEFLEIVWEDSGENDLAGPIRTLAEAQSMVRSAARRFGREDPDQERTHRLLREITRDLQVFVPKYMKLTDQADPAQAPALAKRIEAEVTPVRTRKDRERQFGEARSRLDYYLEGLAEGGIDDEHRAWDELFSAVETLVQANVLRPSDKELRARLLPLLDRRPSSTAVGAGVAQVLREIDRYLAAQDREEPVPATQSSHQSADVQKVANLTRGRSMVLIGGERRVEHEERLERAFELAELIWLEGYGHSYTEFQAPISRNDVTVVLLAVRWASHESGNVQRYCERYGKPLVLLRSGYNANRVASEVLAQAGHRLASV